MKKSTGPICPSCNRRFKNRSGLSCHVRVIHANENPDALKDLKMTKEIPVAAREEIKRLKRQIQYERYKKATAGKSDFGLLAKFENEAKKQNQLSKGPVFAIEPLVDGGLKKFVTPEVHVKIVLHIAVEQ